MPTTRARTPSRESHEAGITSHRLERIHSDISNLATARRFKTGPTMLYCRQEAMSDSRQHIHALIDPGLRPERVGLPAHRADNRPRGGDHQISRSGVNLLTQLRTDVLNKLLHLIDATLCISAVD